MTSPKTKTALTLVVTLFSLSFCCFCTKEDEKNQLTRQEKDIDDFIKRDTASARGKNKDTIIVVTNKIETNRIVWNPGLGDTLAPGDTVSFAYNAYLFRSGKGPLYASNLPLSGQPEDFGKNVVGKGYFIKGLDAGLVGMPTGEYAYIIFTSKYGYGNKELSTIPSMSPLFFEVEVTNIIKKK